LQLAFKGIQSLAGIFESSAILTR